MIAPAARLPAPDRGVRAQIRILGRAPGSRTTSGVHVAAAGLPVSSVTPAAGMAASASPVQVLATIGVVPPGRVQGVRRAGRPTAIARGARPAGPARAEAATRVQMNGAPMIGAQRAQVRGAAMRIGLVVAAAVAPTAAPRAGARLVPAAVEGRHQETRVHRIVKGTAAPVVRLEVVAVSLGASVPSAAPASGPIWSARSELLSRRCQRNSIRVSCLVASGPSCVDCLQSSPSRRGPTC